MMTIASVSIVAIVCILVLLVAREIFFAQLAFKRDQMSNETEMEKMRDEFARLQEKFSDHKEIHKKAIDNLVKQMHDEIGSIRTKASAAQEALKSGRRFLR
jgi:predicted  nucleic acid-binding Zn-ribbon protein